MSRIIKAAELKVLVTSEEQIVIPAIPSEKEGTEGFAKGATILEATNLIEDAQAKAADILARAEEEAHERLQQAEAEVDALRLRAKDSCFA